VNKKTNKLFVLFAVLLTLAMLIPVSAVTVSAEPPAPALHMYLLNPVGTNPAAPGTTNLMPDNGFNVTGSFVRVVPTNLGNATVTGWSILNYPAVNPNAIITASAPGAVGTAFADVTGTYGVCSIIATLSDGSTLSVDKKWAQIYTTVISGPQSVYVTWNESGKTYSASANVTDSVIGLFTDKDGNPELTNPVTDPLGQEPLEGVILHWYLINGNKVSSVPMTSGFFHTADNKGVNDVISALAAANQPTFTTLVDGDTSYSITTFTGANGKNEIQMNTTGEEPVIIAVVPEYPNTSNVLVTPEMTTVNFWTAEMEKVPQVRWAGEKIVLEKFFGTGDYVASLMASSRYIGPGWALRSALPWRTRAPAHWKASALLPVVTYPILPRQSGGR